MIKAQQYWQDFHQAFCQALDTPTRERLLEAWSHVRKRTIFYEKELMPAIAKTMLWKLQIERQRCDYTFLLNTTKVPIVAVESENAYQTAWQEIEMLCSLAAPVKVLLLSCDWQSTKKQCLAEWCEIIKRHHAVISVDCLYAIIVGEWDEPAGARLNYFFTLISNTGKIIEDKMIHTAAKS